MGKYFFYFLLFLVLASPACAEDEKSPPAGAARQLERSRDAQIRPEKSDMPEAVGAQNNSGFLEHQKPRQPAGGEQPASQRKTLENAGQEQGDAGQPAAPARDELDKAVRLVDFSNSAREVLSGAHYSIPDKLLDYAQKYRETWQLPKKSGIAVSRNARDALAAPRGLFNQEEEKQLAAALLEMDKALGKMLGHYRELEKYVADDSIRDDGKKGLELADSISTGHDNFMKARDSWLEIVETRAEEAEHKLLYDHPLQRQILAARNIFAQMREAGWLVKAGDVNKSVLATLHSILNKIISDAAKPPFPASPSLERLYRGFLKHASSYSAILETGIAEGFYGARKREMNEAVLNCRKSYNEFVRAANALTQK